MMKVIVAGDFVPRRRTAEQIDAGDFSCLDEIKPIIQTVDYAIVNFESPVVGRKATPIEKTGPNLKCSNRAMECVAQAGFHCVTLANNHFRDQGQVGVEDTISACGKYGVDFVGGGKDLAEAQKILYREIDGKVLAVINACEHEWSIATELYGGSCPLDIISVCHSLKEARQKADYVLLIVHGGKEYYNLPLPRMKKTYHFFIESGADAVVNHHQHCYTGFEVYQGKPIFYGLGNFCFDKIAPKENKLWEEGFLVELHFDNIISFSLYPYTQCSEQSTSVQMMNDTQAFEENIKNLNSIISDDKLLKDAFSKLAKGGKETVYGLLAPYTSWFASILLRKGLLPSTVNKHRIKQLLAHVQCESHQDFILQGLHYELEKG